MYARGRIDIEWSDLVRALSWTLSPGDVDALAREVAQAWHPDGVAFLTVRTGWDLLIQALDLPKGSEVVCTAVNIPDMYDLLEHHGLVPVPVDLDPDTLAPDPAAMDAAVTEQTRLMMVTHLIGTRCDMDPIHAVAKKHGLPVIEDCAQAFDGHYTGHPDTAVAMFSFGPIKTATALGGGLFRVADPALRAKLWAGQADYPVQTRTAWVSVVLNYGVMKGMTGQTVYELFVKACALAGTSHDKIINGRVLGLKGDDWWAALRRRPSVSLLKLLRQRVETYPASEVTRRGEAGDALLAMLPASAPVLGRDADRRSYWQFCLTPADPEALIAALREEGFDATAGASRLKPAKTPEGRPAPSHITETMKRIVYVPAYPEIPDVARRRLAAAISRALDTLSAAA
jgi:perosamine synthetase